MNTKFTIKTILFCSFVMSNIAFSDTIKVDLTGKVTALGGKYFVILNRRGGVNSSFINIGDRISSSFTFNETPSSVTGTRENYLEAITAFKSKVGNYDFSGLSGAINISETQRSRNSQLTDGFQLLLNEADFSVTDGDVGYNLDDNSISTDALTGKVPLTSVTINVLSDDNLFNGLNLKENTIKLIFDDLSLATFQMTFGKGVIIGGEFDKVTITNLTEVSTPLPVTPQLIYLLD